MISTMLTPARETAEKMRLAMPTIPSCLEPETLNMHMPEMIRDGLHFQVIVAASGPIRVPGPWGLKLFLMRQGMWNWATGAMVLGCSTFGTEVGELHRLFIGGV